MIKRLNDLYPLITVTILMMAIAVGSSLHGQNNQHCHSSQKYTPVNQSVVRCSVSQDVERVATNADERQTKEQKKYEAEIADHEAQVDMAWYAQIGVFLGMLGSALLFWTLSYTRDAANAAGETLEIARGTLDETKDNSRRGLRAYLCITEPVLSGGPILFGPTNTDEKVWFKCKIKNTGQTPAYDISTSIIFISDNADLSGVGPLTQSNHSMGGFSQVHSGVDVDCQFSGVIDFSRFVENGAYKKNTELTILIVLSYKDIFSVGVKDRDKFRDPFSYKINLSSMNGKLTPVPMTQPDKKIT